MAAIRARGGAGSLKKAEAPPSPKPAEEAAPADDNDLANALRMALMERNKVLGDSDSEDEDDDDDDWDE
ncbi:hypothetical protein HK102_001505 [Quaeritorhiza haematococci]|nr:hypothetical protein HK102_001505 [Quaeritorhiza haematococci]